MADREMRMGDQEQFCFSPRLLKVAQLRKRSSQNLRELVRYVSSLRSVAAAAS